MASLAADLVQDISGCLGRHIEETCNKALESYVRKEVMFDEALDSMHRRVFACAASCLGWRFECPKLSMLSLYTYQRLLDNSIISTSIRLL